MSRTEDSIAAREAKTREANKARTLAARPVSKAAEAADKKAAQTKKS